MCTGPAGCGASQCTTLQEDWVLAYVMLPAGGQQRVSMRKEATSQSGHFARWAGQGGLCQPRGNEAKWAQRGCGQCQVGRKEWEVTMM